MMMDTFIFFIKSPVKLIAELAYAAKKTGFIVTETNKEKLSKQQLEEWDNAVQEYLDSASRKIH